MGAMLLTIAALGYLSGILVNALADSLPRSNTFERPRCSQCGAPRDVLAWSGLLAYVTRRKSCAYCGSTRNIRAPIVELVAVGWPLVLYWIDPRPEVFWPTFILSIYFLLIIVIDFEHRLILFVLTVPAAILLAAVGLIDPARGPERTLLGGLVGFAAVFGLYLLGGLFARLVWRLRGEELEEVAFGFGDVALAGVIGLAVGYPGILLALLLGIVAGGLFSLGYLIFKMIRREYQAFMPIPYSPFLIFGGLVVYMAAATGFAASLVA